MITQYISARKNSYTSFFGILTSALKVDSITSGLFPVNKEKKAAYISFKFWDD